LSSALLKQPKAVWAVAFACVVAFMGIGLVDPILPVLAQDLDASPSQVELLFTSYFAVTGMSMLVTGFASSRLGAKRTLLGGPGSRSSCSSRCAARSRRPTRGARSTRAAEAVVGAGSAGLGVGWGVRAVSCSAGACCGSEGSGSGGSGPARGGRAVLLPPARTAALKGSGSGGSGSARGDGPCSCRRRVLRH
jgi:MFS family permease